MSNIPQDTVPSKDTDITISDLNSAPESSIDIADVAVTAAHRAEFLGSFTAKEEAKIMRKVDFRTLVLFGLIYMCKQVDKLYMPEYIKKI